MRKITFTATTDKKRLTREQLAEFIDETDRAGIPDDAEIKARVTVSGYLRQIEVTG